MTRRLFVAVTVAMLASACASGGTQATTSQRNVITSEELGRAGDVSVYDALLQIRPNFLRSRSGPSTATLPQPVQVYISGMLMPGIDHLKQVMVRGVKDVTFLEPQQAIARFGGNNTGGALVVVLM
ncbi:MAG: hypothetical protein JWL61_2911 [Gemmatimonadetes bacterium]|nr:hypothetical protein [Gemmatimonadota bacterium]